MSLEAFFFLEPLYEHTGRASEMLRQVSTKLRAAVDQARPSMEVRPNMEYYATLAGEPADKNEALLQSLSELSGRVRITALALTNLQLTGTEPLLVEVVRAHSKHLARVDFSNNGFSSHMPDALGVALGECGALTHVSMRTCTLHATEVAELMPHLAACTQLTALDLADNFLLGVGTQAVAAALTSLPRLVFLTLSGNGMNDDGARALAAALPGLPTLRVLDLQTNCIKAAGCTALADAVPQCPTLAELHLRHNRIEDEGCEALMRMRAARPTMLVDVRSNAVSAALMVAAQVAGLRSYDYARVNAAQPAQPAWGANGVTDAALCADEPGLCKAELRAMRSLLFLPVDT